MERQDAEKRALSIARGAIERAIEECKAALEPAEVIIALQDLIRDEEPESAKDRPGANGFYDADGRYIDSAGRIFDEI